MLNPPPPAPTPETPRQALDRWEERLEALFEGRPYDMLDAALTDTISGELEGRFGWQPTPHPATGRPGRWCTASATGRRLPQAVR